MSESRCFVAGRFVMADGAGSGDNHDRDGDTFVISKPLLPNSGFDLLIWRRKRAVWLKTMMMMMMQRQKQRCTSSVNFRAFSALAAACASSSAAAAPPPINHAPTRQDPESVL
jgi:hypothetical protein